MSRRSPLQRARHVVVTRVERVVARQLQDTNAEVAAARMELERLGDRVDWLQNEMDRLGPFVAAQGERIGRLEHEPSSPTEGAGRAAAVEHDRAKARLALVAQYEERINRLESQARASLR